MLPGILPYSARRARTDPLRVSRTCSPKCFSGCTVLGVPLNLNGWDVRKAMQLALKSNAALHEWLSSPIRHSYATPALTQHGDFGQCDYIHLRGC